MALKLGVRIWILIILLVFSLLSIFGMPPTFLEKGVLVTSVEQNSTSFDAGLRKGQIIVKINSNKINGVEDYSEIIQAQYFSGENVKTIIQTKDSEVILFSDKAPEITVADIPNTHIKTGLDLSGGARALIQAEDKEINKQEIKDLVDITSERLNVYGISDVKVVSVSDLSGNNFMLVEIAGSTPQDLKSLIEQQGKFEAKIANETVFIGGQRDIASVSRNPPEAVIECPPTFSGFCNFRFTIYLSQEAAERHADITRNLEVNITPQGRYLNETLDLYVDDNFVQSLQISEGLKGRVTTQIAISGSGAAGTRDEAYNAAEEEMKQLQTILITGSLPFKLEIVKLDTISPLLGQEFTKYILITGLVALAVVAIVIFGRYRKIKTSVALLITSISEIIIILGIAALIEWNLDFPSIAGILATVGTGLDDLIIIIDESKYVFLSLKQRIKRAFAIILGAYFTTVVALFPLLWVGAGLLKGFAFTTIIGITVGILITRPAFTEMIKRIEE